VDLLVVVLAKLVLLGLGPLADGLLEVAVGVKAADHEADLARGVGGDGGVGVLDVGEDLLAVLLELGDQGEVEPLVLGFMKSQQLLVSTRKSDNDMKCVQRQFRGLGKGAYNLG